MKRKEDYISATTTVREPKLMYGWWCNDCQSYYDGRITGATCPRHNLRMIYFGRDEHPRPIPIGADRVNELDKKLRQMEKRVRATEIAGEIGLVMLFILWTIILISWSLK